MCATWARSAARSPTTTRRPTIRRRCWRSAPRSSPTSARSPADDFFTGLFETALEDGELIDRDQLRCARQGRLLQVPQSGVALCDDGRLRRQARAAACGSPSPAPVRTASSARAAMETALAANWSPGSVAGCRCRSCGPDVGPACQRGIPRQPHQGDGQARRCRGRLTKRTRSRGSLLPRGFSHASGQNQTISI